MSSTVTADPVRAQVEEALHRVVADVVGMPCRIARGAGRAAGRSVERVTTSLAGPVGLVRSVVELSLQGLLGRETPAATSSVHGADPERSAGAKRAPAAQVVDVDAADSSTDLPLHGYESLAASQVVDRLERLAPGELEAIRDFELSHRGRRTILGKIERLLVGR